MQLGNIKNLIDLKEAIIKLNVKRIKLAIFDLDGVMRGKYLALDKFMASIESGFAFCSVAFAWDSDDQLYDNTSLAGWQTGFGDVIVRVLPETARILPFEDSTLFIQAEFIDQFEALCPRGILRRVIARADSMKVSAFAGCEYEFLVVEENIDSLKSKGFRNMKSFGAANAGYSVLRNSVNAEFYHGLLSLADDMGFPLEALHEESGPGAIEGAIKVDNALSAADKGALFKTFTKVFAQRNQLMASFMAKWDPGFPGQGGHIHMSLKDDKGDSAFHDPAMPNSMSKNMLHFIGGLQTLAPEFAVLAAPTINSYRRLVPGYWAPTAATWGIDNRTVGIRAIPGSPKSQRIEFRIPGADANPYLAMAAMLGAGLWGIAQKIDPDVAVNGNGYTQPVLDRLKLPKTLAEAAAAFRASNAAKDIFGADFVDHFASTREWEEREFRKYVTDWELKRYFEII
jgi:glutamine synthetase